MKRLPLIVVATLAVSGLANAAITLSTPTVTPSGSDFLWTWTASLNALETLSTSTPGTCSAPPGACPGSFFTIYNLAGYVLGSAVAPSGWSFTEQTQGFTPVSIIEPINPTENVSFWYGGADEAGPVSNLGSFSILSTDQAKNLSGAYSYQTSGTSDIVVDQGDGPTEVPSGVPEPASLGIIGMSLLGLGVLVRRRAKK